MAEHFHSKKETPQLDPKTASLVLQNVFDSCDAEPNTIPLEVFSTYENYKKHRYSIQIFLSLAALLLFFLLPFKFILPDFMISDPISTADETLVYHIVVDSHLPHKAIEANLNGKYLPTHMVSDGFFMVEPGDDGLLEVKVTLINGQYLTKTVDVNLLGR